MISATNKYILKINLSHLNNVGLRHNKTVESIMLIFYMLLEMSSV